jgi:Outer membrane protein beta-barrel domain
MRNFYLTILLCTALGFSQENTPKKWGFEITAKFGNGKLYSNGIAPLNGTYSAGDFLLQYKINDYFSVKTGATLAEFNANFVATGNNFNQKNSYLTVPLKFLYTTGLKKKDNANDVSINMVFGLGVQGNNLYKAEVEGATGTTKDKNLGWNFGSNLDWGVEFGFARNMRLGLIYEATQDFTDLDANGADLQLKSVNNFKITYTLDF